MDAVRDHIYGWLGTKLIPKIESLNQYFFLLNVVQ